MRLIRLASTSSDGILDNNFQAEILIKENSQIALDSLTMEINPQEIIVNDKNDAITFSIEEGKSLADKTINITHLWRRKSGFENLPTIIRRDTTFNDENLIYFRRYWNW